MTAGIEQASRDTVTFSVIMPVYNHAEYVRAAVESVVGQTRSDWELIVVDDGSTDGSAEIVESLAAGNARITAIRQENAGPAAARNTAIARARGKWLTFIDSDDVWFPETLARYAAYIADHADARFIHGYRHRLNADGTITELGGEFQDQPTGTAELFDRMYLSHLCVCFRRELLADEGGYDASLRSCEDYELYLRLSRHCRFEPLDLPTGLRRRHETNISRQTGYSRMLEAEVLRRFVERFGGAQLLDPLRVKRRLGRLYYAAGRQYFRSRCFRQAREALELARSHSPTKKAAILRLLSRLLLPLGKTDPRPMPKL